MTGRPAFLDRDPVELKFGTSGLRGLVRDMTDVEVYINTQGFLRYLDSNQRVRTDTPVVIGRDLRAADPASGISSSPRIAAAVTKAVEDFGRRVIDLGITPTPAVAFFARTAGPSGTSAPAVMVTGSHIPADRNGVKFYSSDGEVLKSDEPGILEAVGAVRSELYAQTAAESLFGADGMLKAAAALRPIEPLGTRRFVERYLRPFEAVEPLSGLRVAVYQHSSAARDVLTDVLTGLGADVVAIGRTDAFVAVDTEDVSVADEARYRRWIQDCGADALVSTDGDGDRPLVVDELGRFHRGDVVGTVCAEHLGATFAAVPVSATDAIERHLTTVEVERTRIGSPWVIEAMNAAVARGAETVVGWEANGGFLTATAFALNGREVDPLPTRDALLPIVLTLLAATDVGRSLSSLFARLPQRATRAGLLDGVSVERSRALLRHFRPVDPRVTAGTFRDERRARRWNAWAEADDNDFELIEATVARYFGEQLRLGALVEIDWLDGVRMSFATGEIVHLRPSGNAPQFRVYTVADTQARADELVDAIVNERGGVLSAMQADLLD